MPAEPAPTTVQLRVHEFAGAEGLDAPALAGRLTAAGAPRVVALSGDWADGGELVTAGPRRVVTPPTAAQAFAVPDDLPLVEGVEPGAPGAVGGGWFGYLGFGLSHALWRRPPPVGATRLLPVASWAWHDWVLRRLPAAGWRFEALVGPAFDAAAARGVRERLTAVLGAADGAGTGPVDVRVLAAPGRTRHAVAVEECIRAIRRGDVYQANVTAGLDLALEGRPVDAWARLVRGLRPARAAFVEVDVGAVVGASPELFLARRGDRVVTAPIKGTRPAGTAGEDDVLRGSVKDAAENVMIVDLMRNDLSAVCRPGTVAVRGLLDVVPHAGVWHLVSTVEGALPAGTPHGRLLAATFPPGSVTGVPKVRALEVMAAAEDGPRGVYTGAVGFVSPVAGLELAVAIRTLETAGGRARLGVGGGVTAGSTPVEEWAECLVKAAPLLTALGARGVPDGGDSSGPGDEQPPALFETVLVRDGVVLEAADHVERLARSWWELTRTPLGPGVPGELQRAARALGPGWHRLRLDVDVQGVATRSAPVPPPRPLGGAPGLEVHVAAVGVRGLPRHKVADRTLYEGLEDGADPDEIAVLLVDPDGLVLEGTRANVLAVVGGVLRTPPLDGRILPGVTRQVLLDLADDLGVPVAIGPVPLPELVDADGVLLVNAVRGARWVARLESPTGERRWSGPEPVGVALTTALLARWGRPWHAREVRVSEFWKLVDEEFGRAQGRTLVRDHVLGTLGHRTPQQALDAGDDPREVWLALAVDQDVPEERRWGRDPAAAPKARRR